MSEKAPPAGLSQLPETRGIEQFAGSAVLPAVLPVHDSDRKTGLATLRGGDIGWNTAIDVTNGPSTEWVLNQFEFAWLRACLFASRKTSAT